MKEPDSYLTISKIYTSEWKDKGSRFIGKLIPVKTREEIKNQLQILKKEFPDANHHCYAYRLGYLGEEFRSTDDQEPSGTAGKPILNQLISFQLSFCLLVVIRYFGGTKLGVSGLINAYRSTAKETIEQAEIIEQRIEFNYEVIVQYENIDKIMRILKNNDVQVKSQGGDEKFRIECVIWKKNEIETTQELSKINGVKFEKLG